VVGLGGVLIGIDLGVICGAVPHLEATSGLNAGRVSFVVRAVLLGSVIASAFAGMVSDLLGRKRLMIVSGVLFVACVPTIALSHETALMMCTGRGMPWLTWPESHCTEKWKWTRHGHGWGAPKRACGEANNWTIEIAGLTYESCRGVGR
jgi:MFS family permease